MLLLLLHDLFIIKHSILKNSYHSYFNHHELVLPVLELHADEITQNSLLYLLSFPYFHVCEIHLCPSAYNSLF